MRQDTTMSIQILTRACLCAGILALCAGATSPPAAQTQQDPDRTTVSFSDPSRPGLLHLALLTGNIVVKGADVKEVTIEAHPRYPDEGRSHGPGRWRFHGPGQADDDPEEESRGLHRLTQQPGLNVEEQDNRMSISAPSFNHPADL